MPLGKLTNFGKRPTSISPELEDDKIKEIIEKYKDWKREWLISAVTSCGEKVSNEKIEKAINNDVNKIKLILKTGLDIGTITKHLISVDDIIEKDNEFWFKTKKGLYRIANRLRYYK